MFDRVELNSPQMESSQTHIRLSLVGHQQAKSSQAYLVPSLTGPTLSQVKLDPPCTKMGLTHLRSSYVKSTSH